MFNQLCAIVESCYPVPKLMDHLRTATPLSIKRPVVDVYQDLVPKTLLDDFRMPRATLALDARHECFVVADCRPDQVGLFGDRLVIHCQSLTLTPDDVPPEVLAQVQKTTPQDAVLVTLSKVFARGSTDRRVEFSGEVGLAFAASKTKGMLRSPGDMRFMERMRVASADPEDQENLLRVGHEETLRAAVRALESVIFAWKMASVVQDGKPRKRRKQLLRQWEERDWLVIP